MIGGKCKAHQPHEWVLNELVLIVVSFFFFSCSGGFQDVEKLEKIKPPPDIEAAVQIEVAPASVEKGAPRLKKHRKHVSSAKISPFETREAKKRAQRYAHLNTFTPGEKVTLALTWFSIKAGDVTLEVLPYVYVDGRKAYHFISTAKSSGAMNMIHSVDDWVESVVDQETFYPYKFALHGIETDRLREGLVVFDYYRKKIEYWMKRVHVKKGVKEDRRSDDFTAGVLDIFTAAFYLRAQDLKVGQTVHAEVYNEGKRITVDVEVLRREKLETALGEFDTIVVRPVARFEGILKTSGDSTVWLTDDERHFVLQLETKIKIGYLMAKIKKIEDPIYILPKP